MSDAEKSAELGDQIPGTGRIEAFSDGVIAIIITIMVLELKIPDLHNHGDVLKEVVWPIVPKLIAYALSFLIVAIYWVNHHALMQTAHKATTRLLWSNNLLLFWLSLMPLATAYLGEHTVEFSAIALYGCIGIACALAFSLLRLVLAADATESAQAAFHCDAAKRSAWFSLVLVIGVTLGYFWPWVALVSFVIPPVAYFLPKRQ